MADNERTDDRQPYWWASLRNANDVGLPSSVAERLGWYEGQVRRQRLGSYVLETAIIIAAAAIPVATTVRAPIAILGMLGGVVAVLTGLRQLLRPGENWIRLGGTLVALQREVVLWSAGRTPYDSEDATAELTERAENLVAQETVRWADQRALQSAPVPVTSTVSRDATPPPPS